MGKPRGKGSGSEKPTALVTPPSRGSYRCDWDPGFGRSLDDLRPPTVAAQIMADFLAFFDEWRAGVPDSELYDTWGYTDARGSEAKRWKVQKVRLGPARKYRIALTIVPRPEPVMWLLHAYRRDSTSTKEDLAPAIRRARARWENAK